MSHGADAMCGPSALVQQHQNEEAIDGSFEEDEAPTAAGDERGESNAAHMETAGGQKDFSASQIDGRNDRAVPLPFEIEEETFVIPSCTADEQTGLPGSYDGSWAPGKPLQIAFVTWNMAQCDVLRTEDDVCQHCIRPNAHLVVVSTQENGPYVGLNTAHRQWQSIVDEAALQGRYTCVMQQTMWAIHLAVFARTRDVAPHIANVHVDTQRTGALKGLCGNKGGVGVALTVSMRPRRGANEDGNSPYSPREGFEDKPPRHAPAWRDVQASRSHLSLLFVGSHLTAHQHNVAKRNRDYLNIVQNMKVGSKGPFAKQFPQAFSVVPSPDDVDEVLPSLSIRDVTSEFDVAFFGGDLNYRINGSKQGIEYIIKHHKALRSVLVNNDQLRKEMQRGLVFHGFQEGTLRFRPTYKFHMEKDIATEDYDLNQKKARMPAYCDRVLYKTAGHMEGQVELSLYTDVPHVKNSDHRPVVAMFTVATWVHKD